MPSTRTCLLAAAAVVAAGLSFDVPARAQDAAESAVILSGTAQTGGAQRSLGRSISGSIGNAANTIGSTARPARRPRAAAAAPRRTSNRRGTVSIPANVDALANTDAATYALDNGATIRVSGRFNPAASAHCQRNCPAPPQD